VTPLPRDQFPVTERYRYLDNASLAPLPKVSADAMAAAAAALVHGGSVADPSLWERQEGVRAAVAGLLGVAPHDVSFVSNTSQGIACISDGLGWQPGDRVIVPAHEFGANLDPWIALRPLGVIVDLIEPVQPTGEVPLERFEAALADGPTRLVAASWVQYGRGWRTDVEALATLAHAHGALLCVDAVQGVGVIPAAFAAWGADAAIAGAHKWQLGPEGLGALYLTAALREQVGPIERGVHPTAGMHGYGASLDLLAGAGTDAIWAHVDRLLDRAADGLADAGATVLSDRSAEGRSGILSIEVPGLSADRLRASLLESGVVTASRDGAVRISPHGYSDETDVDALIDAAARLITGR
jgi:selenocysteine lyase/cysteine desulfurase